MGLAGWTVPAGLVAKIAGESFVALRLLSMASLLAAGWAAFGLAREFALRPGAALFVSLLVTVSPVPFWLSTSFMTDAPFHALWLVSLWFSARGLRTGRTLDFAIGAAAAAWAAWIRIPIAAIPIALVAAVWIARSSASVRRRAAIAAAVVLVAGVGGFWAWYRFVHGVTDAYRYKSGADYGQMIRTVPSGLFACTAYAGLFLLPLSPVVFRRLGKARLSVIAAAVLFAAMAVAQAKTAFFPGIHKSMPYLGNILFNLGLGPMTLTDVYREGAAPPVVAPAIIQIVAGVLCAASGGAFVELIVRRAIAAVRSRSDARTVFLVAAVVLYLGAAILFTKESAPLFDRYLVPMVAPLAAILMAGVEAPKRAWGMGAALLLAFAAFAACGTHDYHRFTEARFDLARAALAQTGTPRRVDGGFEFDCWHNYEAAGRGEFTPAAGWKGWLVEDPQYVVAVHERPGYEVADRRSLFSLVGLKRWDLLLLRRR